jgi:hypothetical protein
MAQQRMGRNSIFRDKTGGRVNGVLTARGSVRFELHRKQLAKLAGRDAEQVSDADVVEYMARGELETRKYLGLE